MKNYLYNSSANLENIDFNKWKRKDSFDFFSKYSNPTVQITTKISLKNFVEFVKLNRLSFNASFGFCCLKAVNLINEFHYTIIDNLLFKSKSISTSFTVLDKSNSIQYTNNIEYIDDIFIFNNIYAKEKETLLQDPNLYNISHKDKSKSNVVYMTCLPWITFESVINPIADSKDCVPRICWGKYYFDKKDCFIDVSLQVHHGLMDGKQMCDFFIILQNIIEEYSEDT